MSTDGGIMPEEQKERSLMTNEELWNLYERSRDSGPLVYQEPFEIEKPSRFETFWAGFVILGGCAMVGYFFWRAFF